MKTYEKPKLMVLSISANDALCSSCTLHTRTQKDISDTLLDVTGDLNKNGYFDRTDAGTYFANAADQCADSFQITGYCKFASANEGMTQLFTS